MVVILLEDRYLFKIALATSILGVVGMIMFAGQITPKALQINQINPGMLDEEIVVVGIVDDIKESTNSHTYFLELMDNTGKINVIIFDKNVNDIENNNLKIHNLIKRRIQVIGTVTEYNGRLELILKDANSLIVVA
jgi:DNA/RNA endonuclease YhcR with UshA esterase domain